VSRNRRPPEAPEPTLGDMVVVDCSWSAFHGRLGRVNLLADYRRPLPWVRVAIADPPGQHEDGVLFTAAELVILGQ
jgi:hypothetical protein